MLEGFAIAKGKQPTLLFPSMANRHGLIAGATGTGKTVSLQVLAENFSRLGVPIFMADVKGDLSGVSQAGSGSPKLQDRLVKLELKDFAFSPSPVTFWDVFGESGHPVRTTISEMGPLLLSRLLLLNETQEGVLNIVFKLADDEGLLLLDLKDLQTMLRFASEKAQEITARYGNVSAASIGAIQRSLLTLESQGGDKLFGEPGLNLMDLIQTNPEGRGMINVLMAEKLLQSPRVYSTFLLWMLSELFEQLPEVGDPEKPKLVFFFDEAHLLFDEAPKPLLNKIEQVVRLIRSKGVGVYFITQNPLDVPDEVLGQLGNRVQHALRAFTPRDQKAVKAAAETFRPNPEVDVVDVITHLGVGEALVSFLDAQGTPSPVERAMMYPPHSRIGPITSEERRQVLQRSTLAGFYEKIVDRESAYEMLNKRAEQTTQSQAGPQALPPLSQMPPPQAPAPKSARGGASVGGGFIGSLAKGTAYAVGSSFGRQIVRGILGSLFGGGRRRY